MTANGQPTGAHVETPVSPGETLHLEKLLQTKEMAWLRKLREAQAKEQCRQL